MEKVIASLDRLEAKLASHCWDRNSKSRRVLTDRDVAELKQNVPVDQKYLPPLQAAVLAKARVGLAGLFQCEVEAEWRGFGCHGYNDVASQMGRTKAGH